MVDLKQIDGWADEAVAQAQCEYGIALDYARSSVGPLEQVLAQVREGLGDDDTWDVACRYGAYLGKTMLKDFAKFGYEWAEDYDGEPCLVTSTPQEGASLDKILPINKVNKYLASGPSESPAKLYAMCLSMLVGGDIASNLTSLGVDPSKVGPIEPNYLNKGKFDANAGAWLLYGDYVFFRPQEIAWDGTSHRIVGMQVNAAKMSEIPTLVSNTNLLNGLADLLTELEKDEGLRVPLVMIHPGLHEALRDEDLTGITLFNLMACAQALIVKEPSPNDYQVMCDNRLPLGIPSFYQLVARMIWGMRAYNDRSGSYKVTFVNACNLDADVVLGEVDQMVPGAFSQPIWQVEVTEKPQVKLPSMAEAQAFAREASRVFASGFDDPMDIQADEELFVSTLNQLAREFPITQDIEGTHHMGRIPRIEHVRVGDRLVLAADWQNQWFDPVCIEVFNAAGETLGNLRERFSPTLSGNRELACLLPHVTATVETVTPKSKRRKNAKYALMDVRMELDPAVVGPDGNLLPEVIRDAKALLALPRGERVVVSKGGVVASQLKGNIDVGEAHDEANPLGKTFHLWDVELDDEPVTAQPSGPAPTSSPSTAQEKPEEQSFDTGRWTFDLQQRVQGRRFSVGVPDQWVPVPDQDGRPLAQYVEGIEDDSEYPQIICSSMIGDLDDEMQEKLRDVIIPEARLQMQRKAVYSNDMANKIMLAVHDWVVEGKNCQVMVTEYLQKSIFPGMFPDSYEYHAKPIVYDHEDFLRLADSYEHLEAGELKALAFAVAATIEVDKPVELRRPAELESYCNGPADANAFCETVNVLAGMLNMSTSDRMTANLYRAVRQADNNMQVLVMGDTMPLIQAEAFNEGLNDELVYFGRLVQALEKQTELGTDGFERMWKLVGEFGDGRVVDHVTMSDDKDAEAKINALGIIKIPEGYAALRERWEALRPGPDGKPGKAKEASRDAEPVTKAEPVVEEKAVVEESGVEAVPKPQEISRDSTARLKKSADFAEKLLNERRQQAEETARREAEDSQNDSERIQEENSRREERLEQLREKWAREAAARETAAAAASSAGRRDAGPTNEETAAKHEPETPQEKRLAELRKKWAEEAAQRESGQPRPSAPKDEGTSTPKPAGPYWYERDEPAEKKDPEAERERIARENAEREEKLQQLRKSWKEEPSRSDKASKDDVSEPEKPKKRGEGKLLLVLLVLAAAIAAAVYFFNAQTARQNQEAYDNAMALMESGDYAGAAAEFRALEDYEDSSTLASEAIAQARVRAFEGIKPGDVITLGSYEQDNNVSNGVEPIKWIVLDNDGDKALLLSYYALDSQQYNERPIGDNSWDKSSLKHWTSSYFQTAAFSEGERVAYLAEAPFCLSVAQAKQYLLADDRFTNNIGCTITAHAAAQYPWLSYNNEPLYRPGDTGAWWLCQDSSSTGSTADYAPIVRENAEVLYPGKRNLLGEADRYEFVRPAVYVYVR